MIGADNTGSRKEEGKAQPITDLQDEVAVWTQSRSKLMTDLIRHLVSGKVLAPADGDPASQPMQDLPA